jgi:phage shock protein PspC (stress-responsive transcriptional regulator)
MVREPATGQAGAMTENPSGSRAAPSAPYPPTDTGPRVTREEVRDLSRLRRSSTDKHVAGVAGGLGRHLDIDPVILRVLFVVLTFFGGAGLLVYGACWLLVPADDEPTAKVDLDPRTRNAALIGVGLLGALLTIGDLLGGDSWSQFWVPFPLVVIALVTWLVLSSRQRRRERREQYAAYGAYGAPQAPPPGWVGGPTPPAPPGTPGGHGPRVPPPGTPTYAAPPAYAGPPPPRAPRRPRDPRKRGPILFWFTLALVALGVGTVITLDLAAVDVADSAYPATALGLIALMLLVGAFYGRAGGLILLGLIASAAMVMASITQNWEGDQVHYAPRSAAAVHDDYDFDMGELKLDLRGVSDLAALDGRTIDVEGSIGHLEVIVPDGLDVTANAEIHGPGGIQLFGHDSGGIDVRAEAEADGGIDVPHLTINTTLDVGDIEVKQS